MESGETSLHQMWLTPPALTPPDVRGHAGQCQVGKACQSGRRGTLSKADSSLDSQLPREQLRSPQKADSQPVGLWRQSARNIQSEDGLGLMILSIRLGSLKKIWFSRLKDKEFGIRKSRFQFCPCFGLACASLGLCHLSIKWNDNVCLFFIIVASWGCNVEERMYVVPALISTSRRLQWVALCQGFRGWIFHT